MPQFPPSRLVRVAAAVALVSTALLWSGAGPAAAAPGDPFPVGAGEVFVSQGTPTQLYQAYRTPAGDFGLAPEGPAWTGGYNAMGYNRADRYLYAIQHPATNVLLRIGQEGAVTSLGPVTGLPVLTYNHAAFGEGASAGTLFVKDTLPSATIYAVDVNALTATPIALSQSMPSTGDIVWKDGYLWAMDNGTAMWRIDPANGVADRFPLTPSLAPSVYGAQWRFGNGNLGMSNVNGDTYQVAVRNPASATPAFAVIAARNGPRTGNNDGASYEGASPVDLGIAKSVTPVGGGSAFTPGDQLAYTVTVTNHGPFPSSGAIVRDDLPAGLTSVTPVSPACQVADGELSCSAPPLALNGSATFAFTGTTSPTFGGCVVNRATVLGNEADDDASNDAAVAGICARAYSLTKTAAPTTAYPGAVVTYTVHVANTGSADYTVSEPASFTDDLSGLLPYATYNGDAGNGATYADGVLSWSGPLGVGTSQTVTYSVTVKDEAGTVTLPNVVAPSGAGGSCPAGAAPPTCTAPVAVGPAPPVEPSSSPIDSPTTVVPTPVSRDDGSVVDQTAVLAETTSGSLPVTGTSPGGLLAAAASAVVTGLLVLAAGRRRTP